MSSRTRTPSQAPGNQPPPEGHWLGRWRPDFVQLGARSVLACAMVGGLMVVANWHSSGQVRRGEIQRMLRMGGLPAAQSAETQGKGKLDRGRLKALAATAGK